MHVHGAQLKQKTGIYLMMYNTIEFIYRCTTLTPRKAKVYITYCTGSGLHCGHISRYTIPQNPKNHQIFFVVGMPYLFLYIKLQPEIDCGITLLLT